MEIKMDRITSELEFAQKYIKLGWSIIPILSNTKKPPIKWSEYQNRQATLKEVEEWINRGWYLAVVTGNVSGILIVDDDRIKNGLKEWGFNSTVIAKTQSGGKHYYFKYEKEIHSHCNTKIHIDLKAWHSYCLLPPFNNREWIKEPFGAEIIPYPSSIDEIIRSDMAKSDEYSKLDVTTLVNIDEGARTDSLYKMACSLYNLYDKDIATRILMGINNTYKPPLKQEEFNYQTSKAFKFVQDNPNINNFEKINNDFKSMHRTDTGNAEKIVEMYGNKVRFDHRRNRWLVWDKHRWIDDKDKTIKQLAMDMAKKRYIESSNITDRSERIAESKWAIQSESKIRIDAAIDLAKSIKPIADIGENWDSDPMLLSCLNGIIDLTTGFLRDGKPEDRITMCTYTDFDLKAKCIRWEQFIKEVFENNEEIIHYIHKALGYTITGLTKEQSAFFCFGSGSNGKSVLFKALSQVLGDYAYNAPASLLQRNTQSTNTNDVAATEFKRFLISSETLSTSKLNEQRLKKWTGGDTETARFLYKENFSFEPTVKPWLFINHKPMVDDDSHGFWRRVRLIPFNKTFKEEEQDQDLLNKLKAESKGILRWLVDGCILWQKEGLKPTPEIVNIATQNYKAENDVLAEFLDTDCILIDSIMTKSSSLYSGYNIWADNQKIKESERLTSQLFGRRMGDKFVRKIKNSGSYYTGVALKTAEGTLDSGGSEVLFEPEWWINTKFTKTPYEIKDKNSLSKTTTKPPQPPLFTEDNNGEKMFLNENTDLTNS